MIMTMILDRIMPNKETNYLPKLANKIYFKKLNNNTNYISIALILIYIEQPNIILGINLITLI